MNLDLRIREALKKGVKVESVILGCMGEIVEASNSGYRMRLRSNRRRFGFIPWALKDDKFVAKMREGILYIGNKSSWCCIPRTKRAQLKVTIKELEDQIQWSRKRLVERRKELRALESPENQGTRE